MLSVLQASMCFIYIWDGARSFRARMKTACKVQFYSTGGLHSHSGLKSKLNCRCFKVMCQHHFENHIFGDVSETDYLAYFVPFTDSEI